MHVRDLVQWNSTQIIVYGKSTAFSRLNCFNLKHVDARLVCYASLIFDIVDLTKIHRRHGYGRWLAIVEDPQLELGPVIRGELLLRGVNDGAAGSSKNGDAGPAEMGGPPGRGS
jgi:hypothetical protein